MPIPSDRHDPEALHPSIYRGVTKIEKAPPGLEKYILYNAEGGYMGEVMLCSKYATAETEQMILAIQAMNDPGEEVDPKAHLKLA